MQSINPYLNFPGNAEEAFNFYRSVFGGEFASVARFKDAPDSAKMSEADKNRILHIALPIGNGSVLMATDVVGAMSQGFREGNNFHLSIGAASREEADRIFQGLSVGGNASMPMQQTFWGSYFGMLKDKFGIQWMVSYDAPKP